jgi:hypothetical protein
MITCAMPSSQSSDASYRVLLTNAWLNSRGGTECNVRDLAIGLLHRGHRPIVYSPVLGEFSEEIRTRGIAVIDDLRLLAEPPDIIHGHHLIQTAEALIHFPTTPAIYVCNAWEFWVEQPPKFPQIQIYGAVSEAVRDRLVHAEGIDPEKVILLLNAVDLARVPARRRPLSRTVQRAICFTYGKAHVPILRSACERLGIEFDTLGRCADRLVTHPERELADCDLVFATGRSAIEALCCGAAVIVCDDRGLGRLVNSKNYEKFRKLNFALRALTEPLSIETIVAELKKYDFEDAALITERTRIDASLEFLLDRVLEIYRAIITSWSQAQVETNAPASRRATLDFLHNALPRKSSDARWPWLAERDHLVQDRDRLDRDCAMARQHIQNVEHNILGHQRALSEEQGRRLAAERALSEEQSQRLAAEAELKVTRASRSWQITAPLRRFKRLLWPSN